MAEEREKVPREQDDSDVEAHTLRRGADSEPPDKEAGERETDDPDVEGHSLRR